MSKTQSTHLPRGSDKCLFLLLWGDEWYFTDGVNLCLTHELGLNRTHQFLNQVILGLLLQLQQLAPRLRQRHGAVAQEVEYCAEVLATSVDQDPSCTPANTDIQDYTVKICRVTCFWEEYENMSIDPTSTVAGLEKPRFKTGIQCNSVHSPKSASSRTEVCVNNLLCENHWHLHSF